jgi:hypothetical protein
VSASTDITLKNCVPHVITKEAVVAYFNALSRQASVEKPVLGSRLNPVNAKHKHGLLRSTSAVCRRMANNAKELFCTTLPDIGRCTALFCGCSASPACPYDKSSTKKKVHMENWWDDTDNANRKYVKRTPLPVPVCAPQNTPHGNRPRAV